MNVDEIKQLGEMLGQLSGNAFDVYLLWIGKEVLSELSRMALWLSFIYAAYKVFCLLIARQGDFQALNSICRELDLPPVFFYCDDSDLCKITNRIREIKGQ